MSKNSCEEYLVERKQIKSTKSHLLCTWTFVQRHHKFWVFGSKTCHVCTQSKHVFFVTCTRQYDFCLQLSILGDPGAVSRVGRKLGRKFSKRSCRLFSRPDWLLGLRGWQLSCMTSIRHDFQSSKHAQFSHTISWKMEVKGIQSWTVNRPFYRYGGHIEFIRFKEYSGMSSGHSLSIYARFSGKKRTLLCISREKGDHYYIQTRYNDLFFP